TACAVRERLDRDSLEWLVVPCRGDVQHLMAGGDLGVLRDSDGRGQVGIPPDSSSPSDEHGDEDEGGGTGDDQRSDLAGHFDSLRSLRSSTRTPSSTVTTPPWMVHCTRPGSSRPR